MSADALLEFFTSPLYRNFLRLLIIIGLIAIILSIYFVFSKKLKSKLEFDAGTAPWNLLLGTFLDSFLITILFGAESVSYTVVNFLKETSTGADSIYPVLLFIGGVFALFVQLVIVWIAIRRVIVLRQWLGRSES